MTERLLQFIWQFQYFDKHELLTTQGDHVQIIFPGQLNSNQGPDFLDARIRIGNTTWVGSVELHIHTHDWNRHGHQHDDNYKNVILHVVWNDDGSTFSEAGFSFPVLELKGRISSLLLDRYGMLMHNVSHIPCSAMIQEVPEIIWTKWKERLLMERLQEKSRRINEYLECNNYHWEETCWWMIARNFGARVNADAFEAMARSIPLNLLAKHKHQLIQIESILMGQADLLEIRVRDNYAQLLQKEYRFLRKKYRLRPSQHPVYFLRMRPVNFPTIRLAQLSQLIYSSTHLFTQLIEAAHPDDIRRMFDITANDYWHYHYRFDDESVFTEKKIGKGMIDNIIINTIIPLLFSYGNFHQQQELKDRAVHWLYLVESEDNRITRQFTSLGVENRHAADSQALTHLSQHYCDQKLCLSCAIGNAVLKTK